MPSRNIKYWQYLLQDTKGINGNVRWKHAAADERKEFECKSEGKLRLEMITVRFFRWYFRWAFYKINIRSTVQHARTFTPNTLHHIYHSLPLNVSATLYCHLQGVTSYINIYIICCKQSYVNGKRYVFVSICNVNIVI